MEQERHSAPSEEAAAQALRPCLPGLKAVRRAAQGVSTYVYRVNWEGGLCFARFLPEDATFGVEVLVHRLLAERGIAVPRVLAYVPREPVTCLSLMVVEALPGESMQNRPWDADSASVFREAGRQLALLRQVPVRGFGWIDRTDETRLTGEFSDFAPYFTNSLETDLSALSQLDFTREQQKRIRELMEEALSLLQTDRAVLVHGDLCPDHIFGQNGHFTGFIDFGEIRGSYPFFDLGSFLLSDESPQRSAAKALLAGYAETVPLGPRELRAIELSALAFALGFAGKKAGTNGGEFWKNQLLKELKIFEKAEQLLTV